MHLASPHKRQNSCREKGFTTGRAALGSGAGQRCLAAPANVIAGTSRPAPTSPGTGASGTHPWGILPKAPQPPAPGPSPRQPSLVIYSRRGASDLAWEKKPLEPHSNSAFHLYYTGAAPEMTGSAPRLCSSKMPLSELFTAYILLITCCSQAVREPAL